LLSSLRMLGFPFPCMFNAAILIDALVFFLPRPCPLRAGPGYIRSGGCSEVCGGITGGGGGFRVSRTSCSVRACSIISSHSRCRRASSSSSVSAAPSGGRMRCVPIGWLSSLGGPSSSAVLALLVTGARNGLLAVCGRGCCCAVGVNGSWSLHGVWSALGCVSLCWSARAALVGAPVCV
jgi:hypothetical protein